MANGIYKDAKGELLEIGDTVRVIGVPDLSDMSKECQTESVPVFQHLVGKYKQIKEFDEHGFAWFHFKILRGTHNGFHSVAIEPHLLKAHKPRNAKLPLKSVS